MAQVPSVAIRELRPALVPRPSTPRCEAERIYSYWSERNRDKAASLPQCEQSSSYVINGQHLCKRHAGDVALRLLLAAGPGATSNPPIPQAPQPIEQFPYPGVSR